MKNWLLYKQMRLWKDKHGSIEFFSKMAIYGIKIDDLLVVVERQAAEC